MKEYYGEIPEKSVDPTLVKAAREMLDFCLDRYGTGGRQIRMKWISRDKARFLDCQAA